MTGPYRLSKANLHCWLPLENGKSHIGFSGTLYPSMLYGLSTIFLYAFHPTLSNTLKLEFLPNLNYEKMCPKYNVISHTQSGNIVYSYPQVIIQLLPWNIRNTVYPELWTVRQSKI